MKINILILVTSLIFTFSGIVLATTDREQILSLRAESNQAIKIADQTKVFASLTDDVLITTGNGTLLSGKLALRAYINERPSNVFFVRTPADVQVNSQQGLAWETGAWEGFNPDQADNVIVGGNYSAMWTKADGKWKIKSQLFVTLF